MGHTISELFLTILLALGIGKVSESMQSRQYYATLESGKIIQIEIVRLNRYACPEYCSIPHFHRVHVCSKSESKSESIFQLTETFENAGQYHFMNEPVVALLEVSDDGKRKKSAPRIPVDFGQNLPWK